MESIMQREQRDVEQQSVKMTAVEVTRGNQILAAQDYARVLILVSTVACVIARQK